jgi:diguanylate cyclase (GGDEF)-like protein/PAS domain S-box-containing protein
VTDARFDALVRDVLDVIAVLDAGGRIGYVSPAAGRAWGCRAAELIGTALLDRVHPDDAAAAERLLLDITRAADGAMATARVRLRHADDQWLDFDLVVSNRLAEPGVGGIVATCRDVSERSLFEQELSQLAFRDPLTGLANRSLFQKRLEEAQRHARGRNTALAVLFIDLDNFKLVNDSLGHACGDEVLVAVAARLRSCLRGTDTAARLGGDEFTVLIEDLPDPDAAVAAAERINEVLRTPIQLLGRAYFISASIGIALSTPGADGPDDLLRKADVAMYRSKAAGKGRSSVFDVSLSAGLLQRLELESDLRQAFERDEFRLHYQPIVSIADGEIRAAEALVRWQHPKRGLVSPAEFIPLAEETGLIVQLGQWVLEQACQQGRRWHALLPGRRPLAMAVNLSARQFQHPNLVADVRRALDTSGFDPRRLSLEITESIVMQDTDRTLDHLSALRALGVLLAIDDFGTGYSSLSYLKRFPVDTLKIDRTFVESIDSDAYNSAIVRSVVTLATALGMRATAEGVETAAERAHLHALGCYGGQGYLFARPAPADEFERLLRRPDLRLAA